MSKNLFLVILILGVWIGIIAVIKPKSIPKKELTKDEILPDEITDTDKETDKKLSPVSYYAPKDYTL